MPLEHCTLAVIERCRTANRSAAKMFEARGVEPIDVAIAAIFSAHDLARAAGMGLHEAIEWMRTALDSMESQLMMQGAPE